MEFLRIEWCKTLDEPGEGYMEICPDKFFPCTVEKAKKLFKLVDQWCSDETIAELYQYLQQELIKSSKQMKSDIKAYSDARQKVSDLQTIITDGKHPNGVKLKSVELFQFKEDLREAKRTKCALYNSLRKLKTKSERLNRNIELLHTHTDERK